MVIEGAMEGIHVLHGECTLSIRTLVNLKVFGVRDGVEVALSQG